MGLVIHPTKISNTVIISERTRLKTALGHDQPLPWPANLDEELALAEQHLANPIRDHVPRLAPKRKTRGVLAILDQIDRQNSTRRFTT